MHISRCPKYDKKSPGNKTFIRNPELKLLNVSRYRDELNYGSSQVSVAFRSKSFLLLQKFHRNANQGSRNGSRI